MAPNVLVQLQINGSSLTPALARIADYVRANPEQVMYQTVTELGDRSGASEASVIRFCRDLGFNSYAEFKMALAIEVTKSPPPELVVSDPDDGSVRTTVKLGVVALKNTEKLLDADTIKKVVAKLSVTPRVELFGVGASAIVAQYAAYKFIRLGLNAQAREDPHLAAMMAVKLTDRDVVIAVSSSGSTIDTVRAAQLAKKSGAYIVAITNRKRSPLSKIANAVLMAASPETPLTGGAFASKVGQLLLIEVLYGALTERDVAFERAITVTAEAISDRSY